MTIYDVVKQLIGPITPVGSAHLDKVRYANLNSLIELTDLLLKDIQAVSTLKCQPAVSIANASRCADAALNEWHIWLNEPLPFHLQARFPDEDDGDTGEG